MAASQPLTAKSTVSTTCSRQSWPKLPEALAVQPAVSFSDGTAHEDARYIEMVAPVDHCDFVRLEREMGTVIGNASAEDARQ